MDALATPADTTMLPLRAHAPGQAGYDDARLGYNRQVVHHPELVVAATSVDDVVVAVRHAAAHGLPVAVQATGHGPTLAADGAVLIDTSRMSSVVIDPIAGTATFAAGALGGDVVRAAAAHGLAPAAGSSPVVGAVGYHLGSGLGVLGRELGLAADRVWDLDLVTADGSLHRLTRDDDPGDLFWAVLHAKGELGVVVRMTIDLARIPRLHAGGLWFAERDLPAVLGRWASWGRDLPDRVATSVLVVDLPDLTVVPPEIRGRRVAHVRFATTASAAEAADLVEPMRRVAPPLLDTVRELDPADLATIHGEPTQPVRFLGDHALLDHVDTAALGNILDHVGRDDADFFVELRLLGGALDRPADVPHAVPRLRGQVVCYVGSVVDDGSAEPTDRAQQALLADLAPWSTGHVVPNFLVGHRATPDRVRQALSPADLARLRRIKAEVDPTDRFRVNVGVAGPTG